MVLRDRDGARWNRGTDRVRPPDRVGRTERGIHGVCPRRRPDAGGGGSRPLPRRRFRATFAGSRRGARSRCAKPSSRHQSARNVGSSAVVSTLCSAFIRGPRDPPAAAANSAVGTGRSRLSKRDFQYRAPVIGTPRFASLRTASYLERSTGYLVRSPGYLVRSPGCLVRSPGCLVLREEYSEHAQRA